MERTRIIIADDESIVRADLKEMLTNLGYLVIGDVGDGQSAVERPSHKCENGRRLRHATK